MKRFFSVLIIVILFILFSTYSSDSSNDLETLLDKRDISYRVLCETNNSCVVEVHKDNLNAIINSLNLIKYREVFCGDSYIIEGYSDVIDNYIVLDGLKTNIQMSIRGSEVLVGSPLIEKSF